MALYLEEKGNIKDKALAKLYKKMGQEADDDETKLAYLEKAFDYDDRVGVKTEITKLKKGASV